MLLSVISPEAYRHILIRPIKMEAALTPVSDYGGGCAAFQTESA
jgi:hypothetical protein